MHPLKALGITTGMIAGYLAIGAGVAIWTAARGQAGKPHFQGHQGASAPIGLTEAIALWPWATYVNVTAQA